MRASATQTANIFGGMIARDIIGSKQIRLIGQQHKDLSEYPPCVLRRIDAVLPPHVVYKLLVYSDDALSKLRDLCEDCSEFLHLSLQKASIGSQLGLLVLGLLLLLLFFLLALLLVCSFTLLLFRLNLRLLVDVHILIPP